MSDSAGTACPPCDHAVYVRAKYQPFPYHVPRIEISFDLHDEGEEQPCTVCCCVELRCLSDDFAARLDQDLVLDGNRNHLELLSVELGTFRDDHDVSEEVKVNDASTTMMPQPFTTSCEFTALSFGSGTGVAATERVDDDKNTHEVAVHPAVLCISGEAVARVVQGRSRCVLRTVVRVRPWCNASLQGLYKAGETFVTQCGMRQGFSSIAYAFDRCDVLSSFRTTISARAEKYPILLGNGDRVKPSEKEFRGTGVVATEGRHTSTFWEPVPMPCSVFAIVAGNLYVESMPYTTTHERRVVTTRVFAPWKHSDKVTFALRTLQTALRWCEDLFQTDYELHTVALVALEEFMGAMENKGLNIFNTVWLLASPWSATDEDYCGVERLVGHELVHNWIGGRLSVLSPFEQCLKEGLTKYLDQRFSFDVGASCDAKRLRDVALLRTLQFAEDRGSNAHPIRPETLDDYARILSSTVYRKGMEVINMYALVLECCGASFNDAIRLFCRRFDGRSAQCEDFLEAVIDVCRTTADQGEVSKGRSGARARCFVDQSVSPVEFLAHMSRWFVQVGTPEVSVLTHPYERTTGRFSLTFRQSLDPARNSVLLSQRPRKGDDDASRSSDSNNLWVPIPMCISLLDADTGLPLVLQLVTGDDGDSRAEMIGEGKPTPPTAVLLPLTSVEETFHFVCHRDKEPVVSVLEGFSAPVTVSCVGAKCRFRMRRRWLAIAKHARDVCAVYDGLHSLWMDAVLDEYTNMSLVQRQPLNDCLPLLLEATSTILSTYKARGFDHDVLSVFLTPPCSAEVMGASSDPRRWRPRDLYQASATVRTAVAAHVSRDISALLSELDLELDKVSIAYQFSSVDAGRRALRRQLLQLRMAVTCESDSTWQQHLAERSKPLSCTSLTDWLAFSECWRDVRGARQQQWFEDTKAYVVRHASETGDRLLLHKWYTLMSSSEAPGNISMLTTLIQEMESIGLFRYDDLNSVTSLLLPFGQTAVNFHAADGSGYRFMADCALRVDQTKLLDGVTASKLCVPLCDFAQYESDASSRMRAELARILGQGDITPLLRRTVERALASSSER